MMKKNKQGFSLAEVLIALGIVSVIATFGLNVAKKGMERAYNQYIYTGYVGISDAFADASANGVLEESELLSQNGTFLGHLSKLFEIDEIATNGNKAEFTTNNNIKYIIKNAGSVSTVGQKFAIEMQVPTVRKNNKTKESICLRYTEKVFHILMPYQSDSYCTTTIDNIQDRIDLLPFYLDDGIKGRVIIEHNSEEDMPTRDFQRVTYYPFKKAICKAYEVSQIRDASIGISSCTGTTEVGVIKVANPRKVF
jgi:prepilin-type N-terminal cleavage/methylation domain-containing protein